VTRRGPTASDGPTTRRLVGPADDGTWRWSGAAVLCDLDGVLADSTAVVDAAWRWWAERVGVDPDRLVAGIHGVRSAETVARVAAEHGLTFDVDVEVAALEARELDLVAGTAPIIGAVAFAAAVPPDRFAVVTSGSHAIASARLAAVGVPPPRVFVTADDVVAGKPDPEPYRTAAERLGVAPERCLVLEDTPAGVAAGRAAGATVVGIASSHPAGEPGAAATVVADPSELAVVIGPDGRLEVVLRRIGPAGRR
jgi:mannitol-1-/sugar-/sorbitol-6-phosphatase